MEGFKEQIAQADRSSPRSTTSCETLALQLPNLPDPSVPAGKSDAENRVLREVGEKRTFAFAPKPHWDLGDRARHHRLRARREDLGLALLPACAASARGCSAR